MFKPASPFGRPGIRLQLAVGSKADQDQAIKAARGFMRDTIGVGLTNHNICDEWGV